MAMTNEDQDKAATPHQERSRTDALADVTIFVRGKKPLCVEFATGSKSEQIGARMVAVINGVDPPDHEDPKPVPMILHCPGTKEDGTVCGARHIDRGEFTIKRHHTHSCQRCGFTWRPAVVPTVGVEFLPRFKDGAK